MRQVILLAEDEPEVARTVSARLGSAGHTVRWVRTVRDARAALRDEPPAVLLLDATIETGALDFYQALRQSPDHPRGGVVVLTEASDRRTRERAHQLGAAAVLSKPLRLDDLAVVVDDLIRYMDPEE